MNDALMTAVNRCISRLVLRGWSVASEHEPEVLPVHAAAPRTKSRCYIHIAERDQPDHVTLAVGEGLLNDERDLRIARAVSTMLPSEGLTGSVGFRPDIGAYLLVGLLPHGAGHVPEGRLR